MNFTKKISSPVNGIQLKGVPLHKSYVFALSTNLIESLQYGTSASANKKLWLENYSDVGDIVMMEFKDGDRF